MLIEKRFFDSAKSEDEEIKRELEAEKAKMTEEEKLEEKKQREVEVKEIIRKAEEQMKKHKKIPDSKKIVEFTFLQKAALEIAEHMSMNIKTERKEDDLWGTIEFAFENMWFLDTTLENDVESRKRRLATVSSMISDAQEIMKMLLSLGNEFKETEIWK